MALSQPEIEELVEADRALCGKSLSHFAEQAWHVVEPGREFIPGWHVDAISEHLEAVLAGEIRNLIINIPPRHMKSLLMSVLFPAWAWGAAGRPELRFLFASYAESLSIRDSVKCRRVIQSPWYQERFGWVFQLTGDQNEKRKYENNRTGHRLSTSVDGSGTGEGGDILCFDDPHKVSEAESDNMRQHVIDWHDGEMSSRGNDPKKVARIVMMQRVHEKDLCGHILASDRGYEHLCLPAEFEPERKCVTSLGWKDPRTERGELLWPERFGATELGQLKKDLGPQRSAGQLQQRPAPAEGNMFKRHWWKRYTERPEDLFETMDFTALSIDLPFDEGGTFAVVAVWGKCGPDKFVFDVERAQVGFIEQVRMIRSMCTRWPNLSVKWIEKKANGAAIISTLKKEISGIVAINPRTSKTARAEAVTGEVEAGNVWLPADEVRYVWVAPFIDEHGTFPNGAFNDQVDTTSQALLRFKAQPVSDANPISLTGTSKWLGR